MFNLDNYLDGLPDDFFDEETQSMIAQQDNFLFVPGLEVTLENGTALKTSGVVYVDPLTKDLVTGRKYSPQWTYDVKSDLEPSRIVHEWVCKFYDGRNEKFPHVPVASPVIPPSRFEKTSEFYDVYSYFVNCGYRIYNPSRGQLVRYEAECCYDTQVDGKYIVNNIRDFKSAKGQCVMLDFNPYSPTGIMSVLTVDTSDVKKVKYSRVWKDDVIDGVFNKSLLRYHYDVWGGPILGRKYHGAVKVRAFDLVVTSYRQFESIVDVANPQYREKAVIHDAIHVEPYRVNPAVWSPYRSNLPYSLGDQIRATKLCLPWNNYNLGDSCGDVPFVRTYATEMVLGGINVRFASLHAEVVDIKKKHKSLRTEHELNKIVLSESVFVQRRYESGYDSTIVKRDKSSAYRYVCAYVRSDRYEVAGTVEKYEVVPYKISRYPCNHSGTLIPSLRTLTLEEFHSSWQKIYANVKVPFWLEEPPTRDVDDYEIVFMDASRKSNSATKLKDK